MEYILVRFDKNDVRDVLANGEVLGPTERGLTLRAGVYEIRLSGSKYQPASWYGSIGATDPEDPMKIDFSKPEDDLPPAPVDGNGQNMTPGFAKSPEV